MAKRRPIIFISHSANDDAKVTVELDRIEKYLREKGFDVLLDRQRLQGGDPWREYLHTWMAHCEGAIILLSKKASERPWVRKEATILSWRKAMDPSFVLLPVLLDDLTEAQVDAVADLRPLALPELQAFKKLKGVALAKALETKLRPLKDKDASTPRRLLEIQLEDILSSRTKTLLEQIVLLLGQDLGGWDPKASIAAKLARHLLQAPLEKLRDALGPLFAVLTPREKQQLLVEILRGCWIDPELAGRFAVVALGEEGKRIAAVNATMADFTPKALIARACSRIPYWRVVPVSDVTGEDRAGSIISQVRAHLKNEYITKVIARGDDPEWTDADIEQSMRSMGTAEPVVVVLAASAPVTDAFDTSALIEVTKKYPAWTILVLAGNRAVKGSKVRRLEPVIDAPKESEARMRFREVQQLIR